MIAKLKNNVPRTYVIENFNDEEIAPSSHKKYFQKPNETDFIIEKVIKKKGDKLNVKW